MNHFIFTRFNYPEDYPHLEKRMNLFEHLTKRSILNQTFKQFTWVIATNYAISVSDVPNAVIIPAKPWRRTPGSNIETLASFLKDQHLIDGLVITTRLDSDDIIMPTFVEDIHQEIKEPGLLDSGGYIWDSRSGKLYESTRYVPSPFISLAEKVTDNFKTVYFDSHLTIWKHFPLRYIQKLNWVQVIHDANGVSNRLAPEQMATQGKEIPMSEHVKQLLDYS